VTVRPTGLWLGEAVHFVKKVEAAGYQVDYVSPCGGYTPIDPYRRSTRKPPRRGRFAVVDSRVISGQNPASGRPVADLLIDELKQAAQ
jgi:putative intracellular protease/amidase